MATSSGRSVVELAGLHDRMHGLIAELKVRHGVTLRQLPKLVNGIVTPGEPVAARAEFADLNSTLDSGEPEHKVLRAFKSASGISSGHPLVAELAETLRQIKAFPTGVKREYAGKVGLGVGRRLYALGQMREEIGSRVRQAAFASLNSGVSSSDAEAALAGIHNDAAAALEAIDRREQAILREHGEDARWEERLYRCWRDHHELRRFGFVPTDNYRELESQIELARTSGKHMFVWGETGPGKTEGLKYYYRRRGLEPIVFGCSGDTTQYDLFGLGEATVTRDESGAEKTSIGTRPAGIAQALEEGRPIILDEANTLRPEIWTELNPILDAIARGNRSVYIPVLGRAIDLAKWFEPGGKPNAAAVARTTVPPIAFDGNPNNPERFMGRNDIDTALSRRLHNFNLEYPSHDGLMGIVQAHLIDSRTKTFPNEDVLLQAKQLAEAVHLVQEVHSGRQTNVFGAGSDPTRGIASKLTRATTSPGDMLTMLRNWQADNYGSQLGSHILRHIQQQNAPPVEKALMLQIYASKGLFEGWKHSRVKNIVDEATWNAWQPEASTQQQDTGEARIVGRRAGKRNARR